MRWTLALKLSVLTAAAAACTTETVTLPLPATVDTCLNATSGQICTVAGNGRQGYDGGGHARLDSWLYWPNDIGLDAKDSLFILDWNNHMIRQVAADGNLKIVVGADEPGDGDAAKLDLTAAGADGTTVKLNHPSDLMFVTADSPIAKKGQMLIDAWHNHRFRTWDPTTGKVNVVCGLAPGFSGDGGPANKTTQFNQPSKVAMDKAGNTFIIDMRNWRIRRIDATTGIITTIAGVGLPGDSTVADAGPTAATTTTWLFFDPTEWTNPSNSGGGLAASDDGKTLYVADSENHRIRAIDLAATGTMTVTTIAGTGPNGCEAPDHSGAPCANNNNNHPKAGGFGGDGGPAKSALLNEPHDMAIGPDGRLYFADTGNHRIRAIDLKSGVIETVVGGGAAPTGNKSMAADKIGDGGAAKAASLNRPEGIAFDSKGNLYIADTYNHRIRKVMK